MGYAIHAYDDNAEVYRTWVTVNDYATAVKWLWEDCCEIAGYKFQINPFGDLPYASIVDMDRNEDCDHFIYDDEKQGYRPQRSIECDEL